MPAGPRLRACGLIEVVYAGPASSWAGQCLCRLAGLPGRELRVGRRGREVRGGRGGGVADNRAVDVDPDRAVGLGLAGGRVDPGPQVGPGCGPVEDLVLLALPPVA